MRFMAKFSVVMGTGYGSYCGDRKIVIDAKGREEAACAAHKIAERKSRFVRHSPSGRFTNTMWSFGSLTEIGRMLKNKKAKKV
ncbi:MAG: hypothetical protein A2131_01365 [Candidatus Sungbacteria bacterium GWC2_49_10]|uniref:Uncharacterized protein n=2 Tax=Parcubacteria group TaxID=1794811 RepID=A0A0G1Z0T2_9BACT|nr:MAG: hypothetical protein UY60_C0028G0001 [Parcubacteria group bacterium GW2011_GWB1_50_9]KKW20922.1 MAG: hypothetical protein UY61_C0019G0010 [Candidatus Adlerbacteria bacterium GW2011_GWC1_50_9]OGZ92983.1 MAG: hypothetical protein A2131_01365 [Candidatus Sungbacteria bacterium GWC2_49_10]